jgi:protein-tyrosine phosphatase
MVQYRKTLFICTGNYYRSRLAEILFNHYASTHELAWDADSRGLIEKVRYEGLSPSAVRYLQSKKFEGIEQYGRNPEAATLKDLERADLVIALNRTEHEPLLKMRFGQVPQVMEKRGKLRYWNVYDVPGSGSFLKGLFRPGPERSSQEEDSGTEHIDFAVQSLVWELARNPEHKQK